MLNLPISDIETTVFLILLGIWAGFLFGGFFFGKLSEDKTRRMPLTTRLLSSFTLVTAGWAWFAVSQGTSINQFAMLVAFGMTFGFIGDIFMAQVINVDDYVIYGIASFGIGHIAYIIGMMRITFPEQNNLMSMMGIIFIWWLIALVLWYLVVYRNSEKNTVIYLALPYAILLSTTAGMAMNLTVMDTSFVLIMIGAILFLISDLVLAAQLFNGLHFKYVSDVVWLLYGPGQMMIVFGLILFTVIDSLPFIT